LNLVNLTMAVGTLRQWANLIGMSSFLLACALVRAAGAADLAPFEPQTQPPANIERVVVDSSSYVSSFGGSVDINGTVAPWGSVNESGFRLRATGSVSWYKFLTGDTPRTFGFGRSFEEDLLAGYEISSERFSIMGLVGPALGESTNAGVTTTQLGVKVNVSSFATPTDWTMLYNSFSYSSIGIFSQLQSKVGAKIVGNFYVGPEVNFSWRAQVPSAAVDELRLGAHLSGWQLGRLLFSLSGGWAHDRQLGSGAYVSANVYTSF
jgi:hypothetical protein